MRASGILLPVFSLPSEYGIGTLGEAAYRFVDFLAAAGQRYWQILPLCPTHAGDSPYQSFCDAAGNPYFIDLCDLCNKGLLLEDECLSFDFGQDPTEVDYGKLYQNRLTLLRLAFDRFQPDDDFGEFCSEQSWLGDYALFMALKDMYGGACWRMWDDDLCHRESETLEQYRKVLRAEIDFYCFLQYLFYEQWEKLKLYAGAKGIKIIGDMPIYVGYDSVDVWCHPEQFDLDEQLLPRVVAGCPPDGFSAKGQLWGSPVYDWQYMSAQPKPYAWWRERMHHAFWMYDMVRIDHFRGLESYYCIPYGAEDATGGVWRKGPGMDLLHALGEDFGQNMPIIAEDLGYMTQEVRDLLAQSGFPGMKVLQFAFDSREDSDHLPHNYERNCVVYSGTHDNDTLVGWCSSAPLETLEIAMAYTGATHPAMLPQALLRLSLMSVSDTAIIPLQDWLELDSRARINIPGTLGENWRQRITSEQLSDALAKNIFDLTFLYGRTTNKSSASI